VDESVALNVFCWLVYSLEDSWSLCVWLIATAIISEYFYSCWQRIHSQNQPSGSLLHLLLGAVASFCPAGIPALVSWIHHCITLPIGEGFLGSIFTSSFSLGQKLSMTNPVFKLTPKYKELKHPWWKLCHLPRIILLSIWLEASEK
jgi:hypothetical protein